MTHLIGLSRLISSAVRENLSAEGLRFFALVAFQNSHEVPDVGCRQPQGLDLRELRVCGDVRYAISQIGEGVVYALRASSFLFVRGVSSLRPNRHAAFADILMEMLLKGADHSADDLLADLAVREFVLASMTGLMMMMVYVVVMMMGWSFLLPLSIRQGGVVLAGRGMNVLL